MKWLYMQLNNVLTNMGAFRLAVSLLVNLNLSCLQYEFHVLVRFCLAE